MPRKLIGVLMSCFVGLLAQSVLGANVEPIQFERETLDNGLRVIYAPLRNAPVVHVRVLYHVGSRDEAPDRQGFAHMFEHMMFRGSAHVESEQHMRMINSFGGVCNAFTSFDQTTYLNTIPTNHLQTALWLEADRMASFKVSRAVYETEREVVKEEWRLRYANQPYGTIFRDLFGTAFTTHNYRWPTIGDMDHLAASRVQELQDFHDRYYIPNNACLVIAGDFDVAQARAWVKQYYSWIPRGPDIERVTRPEPEQREARKLIVHRPQVPIGRIMLAWKSPPYRSDDHLKLELLTTIVGGGRSSRAHVDLVSGADPIAAAAQMGNYQLEDPSLVVGVISVLPGKDADVAVERLKAVIAKVIAEGVTAEELEKAKVAIRMALINGRQTAESIGTALAEDEVFGGDAGRVNRYFEQLEVITAADVQAVAKTYLRDEALTVVQYLPGADDAAATGPATRPATAPASQPDAPVVSRRDVQFPESYPKQPPAGEAALSANFNKGVSTRINGVEVLTLSDPRLPMVSVSLVMRGGGHAAAADKTGVASLTSQMLTRGAGGMTATELAEDLESRGISLSADDEGDITRITCFALADQLDHAMLRFRQVLRQPDFPEDEFTKLQRQALSSLMQSLSQPGNVADRELDFAVFGDSPLGRQVDPQRLAAITLEDVKAWYAKTYRPQEAILVFSGAIDPARAHELATKLLEDWADGTPPVATYDVPADPARRRIIIVDNPAGQQASIRMGHLAYDLQAPDRFAGSIATQMLSAGIENRLDRKLRAEKGLTYGAAGFFYATRHGGSFEVSVDTRLTTVGEAVTGAFEVLEEMRREPITPVELSYAKTRVAGIMVLQTQTVQQQAARRVDTILNGYPIDYYDTYARQIAAVDASQVREVMDKWVKPQQMTIVVVAPAEAVRAQLEPLGDVTVMKMPLARTPAEQAP